MASEVDAVSLLVLDVFHVGVHLGPLVLVLEPALFCGVASTFAVGTFLVFRGGVKSEGGCSRCHM